MSDLAPASERSGLRLDSDGAEHHPSALSDAELTELQKHADSVLAGRSGVRMFGSAVLGLVLGPNGSMGRLAFGTLGEKARPVRAIIFDKTADRNWAVAWHQDRTIAVRERRDTPGFAPWSMKGGVTHVEPPFEIMAGMVTLRAHLDDCGADNAPLLIAPGSHRLGRVPATDAAAVAQRLGQASCLARTGDVWSYATTIVHASERARTPCRRRVLHVDYSRADLPNGLEWLGLEKGSRDGA